MEVKGGTKKKKETPKLMGIVFQSFSKNAVTGLSVVERLEGEGRG